VKNQKLLSEFIVYGARSAPKNGKKINHCVVVHC